ncbi:MULTISPECIES: undecaprenyldiphospho-muramoylpentapeptide beta-N-acetylglucosaminyltransferase [Shouchella]|uniref:UDP-N-acetylglucosamine--N-acetylmuramyl-(pentapeptide) pyrophosphoryl-undecaprenol N-acetylglucosamine transferase n=3 Tax=Bacillaceae TaxID=186817 RepID=A0A060M958_9BACI|nr:MULTISPECIES: undecaprenyldiphospho-muramoylpentapeptide beta-N-acetylglucosaminyltransferase [Bacillaceae]RQW18099.1 undecaprenyldiphospho-muramoylpentapeptide beta-N-acetylglucosaminyltransferase [Bacillus sp. C1-1]AIC96609.1 N-acetylglucosaminyltransferase, MurG [Shouchella lehensis G1]KQL51636.1 UDP-diphospho-muramoylpentapeptide beta-N-acetylglucosaminyltransferase [Alkalicoccobacillus plakortidis]MBG9782383.1 UDP-diphospho-muramoylpentapeptide beta-N- acetylglucosaminyltransferase [Sho
MKKIIFTGGGTAGHVTPNLAIIHQMDRSKWSIAYIGSYDGIERELVEKNNIPYFGIASGKLRRYFDMKNVTDLARISNGLRQARNILKKEKPDVVFSKGGFVTVPVVIAAYSLGIPVHLHESDLTPGLANRIAKRFTKTFYTSFAETAKHFPSEQTNVVGSPIRDDLLSGSRTQGLALTDFIKQKPVLLVMGGSLGAKAINEGIRQSLDDLLNTYQIIHICGKGHLDPALERKRGYKQYEYVHEELPHLMQAADIVVTRGGSNAIFEFLALQIPMLIIPLSRQSSRGDQILNAQTFVKNGYAHMLEEESMKDDALVKEIHALYANREPILTTMQQSKATHAVPLIIEQLNRI